MSTHTAMAPGNRSATTLDIATLSSGDVITVLTKRSRWDFVLAKGRTASRDSVTGVAVVTNSRGFGQTTADVMCTRVDRIFRLGEEIGVNGGHSGSIVTLYVNGERRLG